jgi:tetratricopeptide (TPR) repeat protein
VLLSAEQVEGHIWGPGTLNPYEQFRVREPDDMIGNVILVYRGTFDVPLLVAANDETKAVVLLRQQRGAEALALAQQAVEEAPDSAEAHQVLSVALRGTGRSAEADQEHAKARELARANHPDFQANLLK